MNEIPAADSSGAAEVSVTLPVTPQETASAVASSTTTPPVPDGATAADAAPSTEAALPVTQSEAPSAAETKPADEPATAEAKPEGEAKPDQAEPTTSAYTEFKLPEYLSADESALSAYGNILGKYSIPQEAGQELVNFAGDVLKKGIESERQHQQDVFGEMRRGWVKAIDKEFGNRRDTVVNEANWAIGQFGGNKQQLADLRAMLSYTGAGDHPALVRLLSTVAKKLREREAPPQGLQKTTNNAPPWEKRYGATNGSGQRM